MKIILATQNPGKIEEFKACLQHLDLDITPKAQFFSNEVEESGLSFIENAIIKARHASTLAGLPALADDSGLVVSALDGAPGIYSARYAGDGACAKDHMQKLLTNLAKTPKENRQAEFHCILAFMLHPNDPTPLICHGKWSGFILNEPKGSNGFGYDPIFYVPSEQKTAAELSSEVKNKISHRAIALHSLLKLLPEKLHEQSIMR